MIKERLPKSGSKTKMMRTPILLWGDLVKGKRAVTRRSLVGDSAHECMYAWVYLTDYLAIQRLLSKVTDLHPSKGQSVLADFDTKVWHLLNREIIDPHFQLNQKSFETICFLSGLMYSWKGSLSTVVELGQTFFTAIDKFQLIYALSKEAFDYKIDHLNWVGIDCSDFCNTTAQILHDRVRDRITLLTDWQAFTKKNEVLFHSRFVCSYAFPTTSALADFLCKNTDCTVIEDAFSTTKDEKTTYNHGQKEVFFSLDQLCAELHRTGFETFILDFYGDWPSGSEQCLVVKLLIVKKNHIDLGKLQTFTSYHGFKLLADHKLDTNSLMSTISSADWKKIQRNKRTSPVWGRTNTSEIISPFRSILDKMKIFLKGYRSYSLRGQNAERELLRHFNSQRSVEVD
jgi:hypothetical protein